MEYDIHFEVNTVKEMLARPVVLMTKANRLYDNNGLIETQEPIQWIKKNKALVKRANSRCSEQIFLIMPTRKTSTTHIALFLLQANKATDGDKKLLYLATVEIAPKSIAIIDGDVLNAYERSHLRRTVAGVVCKGFDGRYAIFGSYEDTSSCHWTKKTLLLFSLGGFTCDDQYRYRVVQRILHPNGASWAAKIKEDYEANWSFDDPSLEEQGFVIQEQKDGTILFKNGPAKWKISASKIQGREPEHWRSEKEVTVLTKDKFTLQHSEENEYWYFQTLDKILSNMSYYSLFDILGSPFRDLPILAPILQELERIFGRSRTEAETRVRACLQHASDRKANCLQKTIYQIETKLDLCVISHFTNQGFLFWLRDQVDLPTMFSHVTNKTNKGVLSFSLMAVSSPNSKTPWDQQRIPKIVWKAAYKVSTEVAGETNGPYSSKDDFTDNFDTFIACVCDCGANFLGHSTDSDTPNIYNIYGKDWLSDYNPNEYFFDYRRRLQFDANKILKTMSPEQAYRFFRACSLSDRNIRMEDQYIQAFRANSPALGTHKNRGLSDAIEYVVKYWEFSVANPLFADYCSSVRQVACGVKDSPVLAQGLHIKTDWPLFPKDVEQAHNEVVAEMIRLSDFQDRNAVAILDASYDKKAKKIGKQFAWDDDKFEVIVPNSVAELSAEGRDLNHCVKTYEDSVASGNEVILFLRRKNDPTKAWGTIDIDLLHNPNGILKYQIRQVHGNHNSQPEIDSGGEMYEALKRWAKAKIDLLDQTTVQGSYGALCHL